MTEQAPEYDYTALVACIERWGAENGVDPIPGTDGAQGLASRILRELTGPEQPPPAASDLIGYPTPGAPS